MTKNRDKRYSHGVIGGIGYRQFTSSANIGLAQDSDHGMPVELQAGIRNSNLNDLIANYANAAQV